MRQRIHCIIRGKVQGISYRDFIKDRGHGLGLTGFVRNLSAVSVEVVAEGGHAILEDFIVQLKTGYRFAVVTSIDTKWTEATGEYKEFSIIFS